MDQKSTSIAFGASSPFASDENVSKDMGKLTIRPAKEPYPNSAQILANLLNLLKFAWYCYQNLEMIIKQNLAYVSVQNDMLDSVLEPFLMALNGALTCVMGWHYSVYMKCYWNDFPFNFQMKKVPIKGICISFVAQFNLNICGNVLLLTWPLKSTSWYSLQLCSCLLKEGIFDRACNIKYRYFELFIA